MSYKKQLETLDDGLLVRAPAKINLSLLIAGKRPDGFHEIETIMAKINYHDEILIQPGGKGGIDLICQGPCWAPDGPENLIYQACKRILEYYHCQPDIKITLTKNIPAGSGLGSASSDAAATLIAVTKFMGINFAKPPVKPDKLSQIAAELGSDVAFFLGGPLAICTGKGEKIDKIDKKFDFDALLILPDVNASTKKVYNDYNHCNKRYNQLATQINDHIRENKFDLITKMCANMLEESCFGLYRELAELKAKVETLGIRPLCLSGSGSAMVCIAHKNENDKLCKYRDELKRTVSCKNIIVSSNRW